jgi:hypothetical protein
VKKVIFIKTNAPQLIADQAGVDWGESDDDVEVDGTSVYEVKSDSE